MGSRAPPGRVALRPTAQWRSELSRPRCRRPPRHSVSFVIKLVAPFAASIDSKERGRPIVPHRPCARESSMPPPSSRCGAARQRLIAASATRNVVHRNVPRETRIKCRPCVRIEGRFVGSLSRGERCAAHGFRVTDAPPETGGDHVSRGTHGARCPRGLRSVLTRMSVARGSRQRHAWSGRPRTTRALQRATDRRGAIQARPEPLASPDRVPRRVGSRDCFSFHVKRRHESYRGTNGELRRWTPWVAAASVRVRSVQDSGRRVTHRSTLDPISSPPPEEQAVSRGTSVQRAVRSSSGARHSPRWRAFAWRRIWHRRCCGVSGAADEASRV